MAVSAVGAKLRSILLHKIYKILQFLCHLVNSAHDSQFGAHWPIPHKILRAQNCRILTSPVLFNPATLLRPKNWLGGLWEIPVRPVYQLTCRMKQKHTKYTRINTHKNLCRVKWSQCDKTQSRELLRPCKCAYDCAESFSTQYNTCLLYTSPSPRD